MNKIGIIAAMRSEMEFLQEKLENVNKVRLSGALFYCGYFGQTDIVLCECGVGKVNAAMVATLLISQFDCSMIINTGIAGGVGLAPRSVVLGTSLKYHDFDTTVFGYAYGQVPGYPKEFVPSLDCILKVKKILNKMGIEYIECPIFSGDSFIKDKKQIEKVYTGGVAACEMEGAAVAQIAVRSGVDFIVLRFISDSIGEEGQIRDYMQFEQEMALQSAQICLQIVNNF